MVERTASRRMRGVWWRVLGAAPPPPSFLPGPDADGAAVVAVLRQQASCPLVYRALLAASTGRIRLYLQNLDSVDYSIAL